MAYEEDYILRLVKQMIRALMMVLFNKKEKMDTPADTNAPGGRTEENFWKWQRKERSMRQKINCTN